MFALNAKPIVAGYRHLAAAAVAAVFLLVALLSVTPPAAMTRQMMSAGANWLLMPPSSSRIARAAEKVGTSYVEFALAGKMAARVRDQHFTNDVDIIDYALRRVQVRVLNHIEVPHASRDWAPLISGVGFCDQINAAAAQVLAHFFPRSQLYALYDPQHRVSPHTVGRVWSRQRGEWIYFDAWGDRPIVYRHTPNHGFEILNRPQVTFDGRQAPPANTYALDGWPLNEYKASFPSYVASRVIAKSVVVPPPLNDTPGYFVTMRPAGVPSAPVTPRYRYSDIVRAYVLARADDMVGDAQSARARYAAIAALPEGEMDDDALILRRASQKFATR